MPRVADRLPALAGLIDFRNRTALEERCGFLPPAANRQISVTGPAALGTAAGLQPWAVAGAGVGIASGREMAVIGDVRLDNRPELASQLGTSPDRSDCEMVLDAWSRWGPAAVDRLRGDYVFAVWSTEHDELDLVRGPLPRDRCFIDPGRGGSPSPLARSCLPMCKEPGWRSTSTLPRASSPASPSPERRRSSPASSGSNRPAGFTSTRPISVWSGSGARSGPSPGRAPTMTSPMNSATSSTRRCVCARRGGPGWSPRISARAATAAPSPLRPLRCWGGAANGCSRSRALRERASRVPDSTIAWMTKASSRARRQRSIRTLSMSSCGRGHAF